MGFSGDDIRRMAPWAQEQIARQMLRKGKGGVPGCFRGVGGGNPSVGCADSSLYTREPLEAAEKGNKYRAVKASRIMPNGREHVFDSQAEARRYDGLYLLQQQGYIHDLRLQVTFTLQDSYITAEGERIRAIKYVADFTYYEHDGTYVVEDVKSKPTMTRVFRMNRKLMAEKFGIIVQIVQG